MEGIMKDMSGIGTGWINRRYQAPGNNRTWKNRVKNSKTSRYTQRDAATGRFMDQKADKKPFKGVRKEK